VTANHSMVLAVSATSICTVDTSGKIVRLGSVHEIVSLLALLKPCPDETLKIWSVDRMVGNVKNNGPQLILPTLSNAVPV
jgi:hypothetical protein